MGKFVAMPGIASPPTKLQASIELLALDAAYLFAPGARCEWLKSVPSCKDGSLTVGRFSPVVGI